MYRKALDYLIEWKGRESRKPMVIRGARQVGKSYLVRLLAERAFKDLFEVNLETQPDAASLFADDPRRSLSLLEARYGKPIRPGETLLFLDEIQAAPEVFAKLRYLHEQVPELHVVAAGSLLEFVLEDHAISMPVGRIEYLHLGPMTFEEYLLALGRDKLAEFVKSYALGTDIPDAIHSELLALVRQFLVVGGMPGAVAAFVNSQSWRECDAVKQSILDTYRDDFAKYGRRIDPRRLRKVFDKIPLLVGSKFKYTHVDREERSRDLGPALWALCLARVAHRVRHSACNGMPLGAEADDLNFKVLFLDVGLLCRACGLSMDAVHQPTDVMLVNQGAVCEQFVGQHLLQAGEFYEEPELHYWLRQSPGSVAEVDYVISDGPQVIPVEVKAGKTGTLRSLHSFLHHKRREFGVRFNTDKPSFLDRVPNLLSEGQTGFRLLSLPLYMVNEVKRLSREALGREPVPA
jgi:predicted AAA+ superfamily ATPase